jgi:cell division protein FtsB
MKIFGLVLAIICFLCFSSSVFGELSVEDLEKIREVINEVEVRLGKRIDEVEVRLGKRIDGVEVQLDKRISTEIQALGKRIDFQGHLIIALIVAIIAFVAVPMGIIVYQYNRNRDQQEAEIRAVRDQQEEIKVLRQRIEELERERLIKA